VPTSKKPVSQDSSCVNLQELEENYEKDLLKDLLTEAGGSTPPEKEDSSQKAVTEKERRKTKKIPFLRKHIPQLETLDFDQLEKEANVKFNEHQQQRILDLLNTYRRDSTTWEQGTGGGKAKTRMEDTAKAANALSDLLSCETTEKHAIVDHYWPPIGISPLQLRMILAELTAITTAAAKNITPSRGNPGDPHIYTLVRRLHYIWTQAGGKGRCSYYVPLEDAYSGAFFFFLQEIIEQADLSPRNSEGLHKIIVAAVPSA